MVHKCDFLERAENQFFLIIFSLCGDDEQLSVKFHMIRTTLFSETVVFVHFASNFSNIYLTYLTSHFKVSKPLFRLGFA